MKTKILFLTSVTALFMGMTLSCKKAEVKEPEPGKVKTCYNMDLIKEQDWIPVYSYGTKPKFYSNGQYFENGKPIGTWASNSCDCVIVKSAQPANTFFFKIQSINEDTLKVYTPRYNCTVFHK